MVVMVTHGMVVTRPAVLKRKTLAQTLSRFPRNVSLISSLSFDVRLSLFLSPQCLYIFVHSLGVTNFPYCRSTNIFSARIRRIGNVIISLRLSIAHPGGRGYPKEATPIQVLYLVRKARSGCMGTPR